MKSLLIYVGCFLAICSVSLYQSCQQTDHITCLAFEGIDLKALDLTTSSGRELKEGDSVYAKKFAFTFQSRTVDTICKRSNWNIMNSAYAYKFSSNTFMKDSVKSIEIYSKQDFNTQYPAGSVLNNLFNIPPIQSGAGNPNYYGNPIQISALITLETIPEQTKDFKFYVKTTTKENLVFIDSLPTIKIKL